MKKRANYSKSRRNKREDTFTRILIGLAVVLVIVLVAARFTGNKGSGYTVTEDGHVHGADGSHFGTVEGLFGEGATVTEEGHVHAADGTHIGNLDEMEFMSSGQVHAEDAEN